MVSYLWLGKGRVLTLLNDEESDMSDASALAEERREEYMSIAKDGPMIQRLKTGEEQRSNIGSIDSYRSKKQLNRARPKEMALYETLNET